jgi:6,7-dimethyl-8-ribityllumazine synthase
VADIQIIEEPEVFPGSRLAVVASRYNRAVVDRLLDGCLETLADKGIPASAVTVIRTPGAFELPVVAKRLAAGGEVDAVIALGAVIRGETPHFDFVAGECARGLAAVAVEHALPVIFGVLTVDSEEQARARAGGGHGNKGTEAALTALEMIAIMHKLGP